MLQRWWFLLSLCVLPLGGASHAAFAGVGVCWTRNGVRGLNASELEYKLRGVFLSASLLREGDVSVPLCLLTDATEGAARDALDALSAESGVAPGLIGHVLDAPAWAPGVLDEASRDRDTSAFAEASRRVTQEALARFESRAARLLTFASPPFETTLFVDDDIAFCGVGIGTLLRAIDGVLPRVDAFFTSEAEVHGDSRGKEKSIASDECASSCAAAPANASSEATCVACRMVVAADGAGGNCPGIRASPHWAQAGAVVLRRSRGTEVFVTEWLKAFTAYHLVDPAWHRDRVSGGKRAVDQNYGRDQPPLDAMIFDACGAGAADRPWRLAKLPPSFNARPMHALALPVWGQAILLHAKHLTVFVEPRERAIPLARAACATATANTSWRLLAMPSGGHTRDLAKLPCTTTADGLVAVAPYGHTGDARAVIARTDAAAARLLRQRRDMERRGRCTWGE